MRRLKISFLFFGISKTTTVFQKENNVYRVSLKTTIDQIGVSMDVDDSIVECLLLKSNSFSEITVFYCLPKTVFYCLPKLSSTVFQKLSSTVFQNCLLLPSKNCLLLSSKTVFYCLPKPSSEVFQKLSSTVF
ncbi:hypothetical protein TNCV_1060831 [Trichonephila clavipes]|nr:hypothetical protein TNCV_1060831 [Trichonephila clavipes]